MRLHAAAALAAVSSREQCGEGLDGMRRCLSEAAGQVDSGRPIEPAAPALAADQEEGGGPSFQYVPAMQEQIRLAAARLAEL